MLQWLQVNNYTTTFILIGVKDINLTHYVSMV